MDTSTYQDTQDSIAYGTGLNVQVDHTLSSVGAEYFLLHLFTHPCSISDIKLTIPVKMKAVSFRALYIQILMTPLATQPFEVIRSFTGINTSFNNLTSQILFHEVYGGCTENEFKTVSVKKSFANNSTGYRMIVNIQNADKIAFGSDFILDITGMWKERS